MTGHFMKVIDMKIRIPADLKSRLEKQANQHDRTINGEVLQILKAALTSKPRSAA